MVLLRWLVALFGCALLLAPAAAQDHQRALIPGDRTIADDRTRHHAPRARMDGWWPAAARIVPLFSQPPNARRAAEDCI